MDILLILATGTLCIVCILIGAKIGQKVSRDETIELPNLNPIDAVIKTKEKMAVEKEKSRVEKIMQNIDNYDGTGYGQIDV
jgi:uncharacterized protein YneF (UPF0154 family)